MKVRCLTQEEYNEPEWYSFLTHNKIYDVVEITANNYYLIITDDDNYHSIPQKLFEPLRNRNLDLLLKSV